MRQQTFKKLAPPWALTEIAIKKGRQLARKYKAREDLVLAGVYLSDCVSFQKSKGGFKRVRNHEELSAKFAEKYLRKWKADKKDAEIILNAIRAHHEKVRPLSKEAEIVKHADCFKFLSLEGIVAFMHILGERNMPLNKAANFAKLKAKEKLGYISLPGMKKEANKNYKEVVLLLNSISKIAK